MRKLFFIACANMRKAKGQTAAIAALILLASLMLNLWLMLSIDYRANFDRYHDKLNAEHVTLAVEDDDGSVINFLRQTLDKRDEISQYRLYDSMFMVGTFPYNGGTMNGQFVFLPKAVALSREIGRAEIVEDGGLSSGVYLPMLYKTEDINTGKPIEISIGSHAVQYYVCGFFNSVMLGSHNCGITEIILTQDKYDELLNWGFAPKATLCSVRLKDISRNLNTEAELKSIISNRFPNIRMASNCYDVVSQSRYISQTICSGIISAMAFFILLIALVIIISNIINYIRTNLKNLGVYKAEGYTSRQLICALLFQFTCIALLAAIAGAAFSYCIFPAINSMMILQTGIPYSIGFLPLPAIISLFILCGTVAVVTWFSVRRIKKIDVIAALNSCAKTHEFKRNRIALDKTKAPLNLALAFKTTLSGIKNNITACITMLVLSLVIVFSNLMTENVICDMTPFLNLIVGETADSCINVSTEIEDEFIQALKADSRVEKVYLYNSVNVSHEGGAELMATLCNDFSQVNNSAVVFKGRFPKYDNELALAAKYAKEKGFDIGDEIEITANGNTEKYLISGFTQITNFLGRDCLLTRKGYERLGTLTNLSYYINLTYGTDIDAFNEDIKEVFSGNINTVINIDDTVQSAAGVYVSLMTVIVIAILVLSVIIIAFVLYLLVRALLTDKMRDYGILKSLGFTSGQLIIQTALSFMPAIILSAVVGLFASALVINPLTALFLSGMGIVKCTFNIPFAFTAISGAGLILISFGIACLMSLRIKNIAPRNLFAGE